MLDILIVEDNKEIGGLLQAFLQKENYAVSELKLARRHWIFLRDTVPSW